VFPRTLHERWTGTSSPTSKRTILLNTTSAYFIITATVFLKIIQRPRSGSLRPLTEEIMTPSENWRPWRTRVLLWT
ncbi:hypothetical protein BGX30_002463, partial [Mortierella sp. GBA39]